MAWAKVYFHTKWRLHSSPIQPFGHNRHGRKLGGCAPFWGELGPHLAQNRLGQGLLHTKWHLSPSSRLDTTDMGRKLGAVPLQGSGSWVPILHNVARAEAYLHAKFHLAPSSHLATICQRCRQDRQTVVWLHRANHFTNGRPEIDINIKLIFFMSSLFIKIDASQLFVKNPEMSHH